MTKVGKLFVCDRCGNTGFAEYKGTVSRDGGFDIYGTYEKLQDWGIWEGKNLCPKCNTEYRSIIDDFWKEDTK